MSIFRHSKKTDTEPKVFQTEAEWSRHQRWSQVRNDVGSRDPRKTAEVFLNPSRR